MRPVISRVRFQERVLRRTSPEYIRHQLVADLFGDRPDRGYLFRVEEAHAGEVTTLVLSKDEPVPTAQTRWGEVLDLASKPFVLGVAPGSVLDFEIRVNATRVQTVEDRKLRRDVWDAQFAEDPNTPQSPVDVYRAYLSRKLDGGATVRECAVAERRMVRAARGAKGPPISFVATNLAGTLTVHDQDVLVARMMQGIGRAKAFGCGLLCLSRPGTVLRRRRTREG